MRRLSHILPIFGFLTILFFQTPVTAQEVPSPSDVLDLNRGRGGLILSVEDPLFRMFRYGGYQLDSNAVIMGPAF
jgi:hypothetical protein